MAYRATKLHRQTECKQRKSRGAAYESNNSTDHTNIKQPGRKEEGGYFQKSGNFGIKQVDKDQIFIVG